MNSNPILEIKITLNNGVKMPKFGLGTYLMKNETEIYDAVKIALANGYRSIDTAEYYGNETVIGKAIKDFLAEHPEVKREELFITSKIWNTNHQYDDTKKALAGILERLQLSYLDLCLIHWPTKYRYECWKALEELYKEGKVKAIGVSNFKIHHLEPFLKVAEIKPVMNQIESHPGFSQMDIIEYCKANDIAITGWRTIMGGKASEVKELQDLATKYNTEASNVALRWAWQLGEVIIPKSVSEKRIISNAQINQFQLTEEEMTTINQLPMNRLGVDPDDKSVWKDMID